MPEESKATEVNTRSLYPWQKECLKAWESHGHRGIAHVATGAGKTVFALETIRRFRAKYPQARVKVVVPTIALAYQWQTALMNSGRGTQDCPGFFGAGHREYRDRSIVIYVINSARDHLAQHVEEDFSLGKAVFLICDECHHYQSRENRKIFAYRLPAFYSPEKFAILGLSATPFGTEHDEILKQAIGEEIYRYGFDDAAADGVISSFAVLQTAASFQEDERKQYQALTSEVAAAWSRMLKRYPQLKDLPGTAFQKEVSRLARRAGMDPSDPAVCYLLKTWKRKEAGNLARTRLRCAMAILRALPSTTRVIIFCERISQAEDMLALLRRAGAGHAVIYHSKMSREARDRSLELFRNHQARILVSCKALDEGIDVPDAGAGIVLSSTAVTRQRIQRLGRILRRSQGKTSAWLYYIYLPESTDERVYLPGTGNAACVNLRYDAEDDTFSNDLYEYAACQVMEENRNLSDDQRRELRRCLLEGLPRADYLMKQDELAKRTGTTVHERNYWCVMRKIGKLFDP